MRRSTYVGGGGGGPRASLHMNNNHGVSGAAGGRGGSFHRQDSMALQHAGSINGHAHNVNVGAGVGIGRASIINEKRWGTLIVELLEEGAPSQQADAQL